MRRAEKQINDFQELMEVIASCQDFQLAMAKDNMPYVVPLNFGYKTLGDKLTIYFHCALEGKKIDILKHNPCVCFSMYSFAQVKLDDQIACKSTTHYKSVIGEGVVSFIEDDKEKFAAMENIMLRYGYKGQMNFAAALARTHLCKITVSSITGKQSPS